MFGMIFRFPVAWGGFDCISLNSSHRGNSNEYRQYTFSNIKDEIHSKLSKICKIILDLRQCVFFFSPREW